MNTAKFVSIGDSLGLVLPESLLERLQASDGGEVLLTETAHGIILQPMDSDEKGQLKVAMEVMDQDSVALKKLAE